jgi:hypothetical protein
MKQPKKTRKSFFELSRQQQVVLVILVVLGVGGLVLGARSFGTNIRRPFVEQLQEYAKAGDYLTPEERARQEEQELKSKDTDGDGLNDYDELNVFNTSPYLKDTDSDGFDDQTEVFSNNDPNCPEGEDCSQQLEEEAVPDNRDSTDQLVDPTGDGNGASGAVGLDGSQQLDSLLDGVAAQGGAQTGDSATAGGALSGLVGGQIESQEDLMGFFNSLSADQIRAAMIDAGIPEEQLEGLSDEEVKELFNQAVGQAQDSGALSEFDTSPAPSESSDSQTQQ